LAPATEVGADIYSGIFSRAGANSTRVLGGRWLQGYRLCQQAQAISSGLPVPLLILKSASTGRLC